MLAPPSPEKPQFGPIFQEIAELTSESTALRLIAWFGGQRIVFPLNPRPSHRLSMVVGQRHFETLCYHFGGIQIDVPKGAIAQRRRNMQIMRGLVRIAGWSDYAVAKKFGVTRQYVNLICQPDKDWIGMAPVEVLQTFTPTFQLRLDVGFERDDGAQWEKVSMIGDAFKAIRAYKNIKKKIAEAQEDGKTNREELLEIGAYFLSVLLEFDGVGQWIQGILGEPQTEKGKAAVKATVEALEGTE
ncbi:MAG: hypothetical protein AAGA67_05540 [Cyanobacteria bacterium P01_F01_bin.153]